MPKLVNCTANNIQIAADIIKTGGLVAFPTETVYGLGANALNPAAAKKIYAAKGRPNDNPLIVHLSNVDEICHYTHNIPNFAHKLIESFMPGSLTLILPKNDIIPYETTGELDTVAVRVPSHPVARALIQAVKTPIAAPSANISGRPSPTTAQHVLSDFANNDTVEIILDNGQCTLGLESTIVDATGENPTILRPGCITAEQISSICGQVLYLENHGERPKAPGMKYRHYAPTAPLTILRGSRENIIKEIFRECADKKIGFIATHDTLLSHILPSNCLSFDIGDKKEEIASNVFLALRTVDTPDVSAIFAEYINEDGVGAAIMNRLRKAASEFREVG